MGDPITTTALFALPTYLQYDQGKKAEEQAKKALEEQKRQEAARVQELENKEIVTNTEKNRAQQQAVLRLSRVGKRTKRSTTLTSPLGLPGGKAASPKKTLLGA